MNGRVTFTQWAIKADGRLLNTLDIANERYGDGYLGPKLFLDKVSANRWILENGKLGDWEPVPVSVEIRELTLDEYREAYRKENVA